MNREARSGPILHVACLVYPSYQGTQAAIGAMLDSAAQSGAEHHLLTYAHGAYERACSFEQHRLADFPKCRSLRSGPSLRKVALDLRCIAELRRLAARLRPAAIVAHHVEAAAAALAAGVRPVYYVAHTSLSEELPQYFPRLPSAPIGALAGLCEQNLCRAVDGVAAVAPALAERLGPGTDYLPVPWMPSAAKGTARDRSTAREMLGLPARAPVCLYAGNLDAYQGWEHLLEALSLLRAKRPDARLLLATESDPGPARSLARRRGLLQAVRICRLDGEPARRRAHAAADLAWIPRRTPGGLPIKMLDAFSRALPVVAMERATAGLQVSDACVVVRNDDPMELARGAERLLCAPDDARQQMRRAELYLCEKHSVDAFNSALSSWVGRRDAEPALKRRRGRDARAEPVRPAR